MPSEWVDFPFLRLRFAPTKRPIVWLFIKNTHAPDHHGIRYPALLDTGADRSLIPHTVCKELGHVFSAGIFPSDTGGIGDGRMRTFKHASKLTLLATPANGGVPFSDAAAFPPLETTMTFVEQDLPFALLGQADFLQLFEYRQNRAAWTFSLRRVGELPPSR